MLGASAVLLAILLALIGTTTHLTLKPISKIKEDLRRLQSGKQSRLNPHVPEEFRPLIRQLHDLLELSNRRLDRHRRLPCPLVIPPDHRLRQVHGDRARIVGVAKGEDRPTRLDVVQRRHSPGEGRQPRPVVGVEAAARQGWDRWLTGERGKWNKADFVGMDRFGASAPAEELFEKFGITAQNVADKAKALL